MGILRNKPKFGTIEITQEWLDSGNLTPSGEVHDALYIMPHEDDGGIGVGEDLLTSLHRSKFESSGFLGRKKKNVTPPTAFEMTYSQKTMGFDFTSRSASAIQTIEGQLGTLLPNSDYERHEPHLLDFKEGHHIAAAELRLRDYTLLPLRRADLEGFESDPLGSIAAEMIGLVTDEIPPAEVAVQTVMKPAGSDWIKGVNGEGDIDQVASDLEQEKIRNPWHPIKYRVEEPSKMEEKTARLVRNQEGRHGWWFNIRIIAASADPEEAIRRVKKTGNMYNQFYSSDSNQGFETDPLSGDAIKECVENAVERKYVKYDTNPPLKSKTELTGLVHIPDGDVKTRDLERATTKGDSGVPPSAPEFKDFDETGYSDSEIPRRSWEQQNGNQWDWPYSVTMEDEDDYITANAHEYGIDAREGGSSSDTYAGAHSRAMIENSANVDQPYWIGLDSRNQTVPILHKESFRHTFVTGQTGTGKSTYVLNRLQQHAMKGHGFAFVDPGGEDCYELLKALPEDRLDDVVFIDITRNDAGEETGDSRHIGFNFLETHHEPGEKGFAAEVEGIISDILPLLEAGEYQRMKGVAANILRALIRANYAGTGYTFTLLDMYYILSDEEGRQRYAQFVREEEVDQFLEIFADEVAKLDDSDLEPLIRRLQTWIENAMIRPIVSERDPQFSIAETVEENKILIVKCDTGDDVRQMVSSTITRKIWSVVTARPSRTEQFLQGERDIEVPDAFKEASAARGARMDRNGDEDLNEHDAGDGTSPKADAGAGEIHVDDLDLTDEEVQNHDQLQLLPDGRVEANNGAEEEHDPFYLVIDELHAVLSEESQVDQMLAEARKKRLGLVLLTQQTNQLPDKQRQRIMSNCSTLMAFNPGNDGKERGAIASGFSGITGDDLGLDRYHAWTMITDKAGSLSEPFVARMLPPYPPRRGLAEVRKVINRSLDEYGTEMKSDAEIHGEVPDHFSGGGDALGGIDAEELVDTGLGGPSSTDTDLDSDQGKQELYEALHTVQIRADALGDFVPSEEVTAEWKRRTNDDSYDSIPSNLIESDPNIKQTRTGGEVMLNITNEGLEKAGLTYNTGSSASGGKADHRMILQFAHQAFTKLGLETWLPEQEGDEEADGMANLPIDPSGATSFRQARQLEEDAREQLIESVGTDAAVDLTDGRHISIEAETSTMKAPEQTLTNLRKALDADRFCIFACKDEYANEDDTFYWPKRGEKIIYDTYRDGYDRVPDYDKKTFARDIDEDDNREFYNRKKGHFQIEEDVYALRKRTDLEREREETTEIYWAEDGDDIVMRDRGISDGEGGYEQDPRTHLRFDSQQAVANAERQDVEAYYSYDQSEELYTVRNDGNVEEYESKEQLFEKWARFFPPFLPDVLFPHEPNEDDYAMVVFPDDDNPEYDEPMVYDKGDVRPLFPDEIEMPEIPDVEDMPDAGEESSADGQQEETSSNGATANGEGNAEAPSPNEGLDNAGHEKFNELTEAVAEADGVSQRQAEIAADAMVDVPMDWESKVTNGIQFAQNITPESGNGATANGEGATTDQPQQPNQPDQPQQPSSESPTPSETNEQSPSQQTSGENDSGSGPEPQSGPEPETEANGEREEGVWEQYTDASAGASGFSRIDDGRQKTDGGTQAQTAPQRAESDDSHSATPEAAQDPAAQQDTTGGADNTTTDQQQHQPDSPNREGDSSDGTNDTGSDTSTKTDTPPETNTTTSTDAEDTENTNQAPDDPPDEAPDEATSETEAETGPESGPETDDTEEEEQLTYREQLDQRVAETEEIDDMQKVIKLTDVLTITAESKIEANRKAQQQVFGEIQYDPHEFPPDQSTDETTDQPIDYTTKSSTSDNNHPPQSPQSPQSTESAKATEVENSSESPQPPESLESAEPAKADNRGQQSTATTTETTTETTAETPTEVSDHPDSQSDSDSQNTIERQHQTTPDDGSPEATEAATSPTEGGSTEATTGSNSPSEGGSDTDLTTHSTSDTSEQNTPGQESTSSDPTPPNREDNSENTTPHNQTDPSATSNPSQQGVSEDSSTSKTNPDTSNPTTENSENRHNEIDNDSATTTDESQTDSDDDTPWSV